MHDIDAAPLLDVIAHGETLQRAVDTIPMAAIAVDAEGLITLWGGTATELYGWRPSEVVGRPLRDLITFPEDGATAADIRERLWRGEQWMGTFHVRHKDGSTFEAWVVNSPMRDEHGRVVGILGLSVDVAAASVARADQAIHEAHFRSVVETSHDGIWMIDLDARTTFANEQMAAILGCSLAELEAAGVRDFLDPADLPEALRLKERLTSGVPQQFEQRFLRRDGRHVLTKVATSPLLGPGGELVGILGTMTDVTEARAASLALRASAERFRRVFDESPQGKVIVDRSLAVVRANAAFGRMVGCDPEELTGAGILALTHPDDVGIGAEQAERLFTGDLAQFQLDKRYLAAGGETVYARTTVSALREPDGEIRHAIALIEDLTAVERAASVIRVQQDRLAMALDAAGLAAWELDLCSGEYTMADNLDVVFGVSGDGPLTFPDFLDRVVPEDRHLFLEPVPEPGTSFNIAFRVVRHGEMVWLRSRGRVIGDEDGRAVALRGTTVDITESMLAEAARAEFDAVHRRTLEAVPDAFVGVDGRGRVTDWNPAAVAMFGWSLEEAIGATLVDLIFLEEDRALYQERIEVLSSLGTDEVPPGRIELAVQHRNGRTFPVEMAIVVVTVDGAPQMRAFIRDITARRAYERDLTDRVLVDQTTGLPNRTLLMDRLERTVRHVTDGAGVAAVLFIDIDRFKGVNESLGHSAGDALLAAVAARLHSVVGDHHTVARHGSDEFIVLCESLEEPDEALRIAAGIQRAFGSPVAVGGRRLNVDLSIGLAPVRSGATAEDVVRDADIAKHQAQSLGGARTEVLDPSVARQVADRLDLEGELRRALATGQITVAYQPVVSLDGKLIGFEALARWEHPERGTITPAEFIPVAEETGLVVELGAHVLDTACRDLAVWRRRPDRAGLTMAVNLSGRQLVEADLAATILSALAAHDLPVDAICLEITESMLMDDVAGATVDHLAELGLVLSVDDFGTGYSSLLYLRRFPVHALKLDRSFVSGIGTSEVDTAIVGSMIDLAHALHLVAVAEGVETVAQAAALESLGCDYAQGYLYSRPVPADSVDLLLDDPRFG